MVKNDFDWRMEYYYNQTDREFGTIDPKDELPPIRVIESGEENILEYANLDVFVNSPYSAIKPIEIIATNIENTNLMNSESTNRNG